jgi:predicted RND superfamily exporter protein
MSSWKPLLVRLALLMVPTLLAIALSATRLRISSDLSTLFPSKGDAAALGRYTRAFGGGDVGLILLRGDDPPEVAAAAHELKRELKHAPSVVSVLDRAPLPTPSPTRAWLYAGPAARERLAKALTPEGMAERLAGTRELLLTPAHPKETEDLLARDPLRLAMIPWEGRSELAAGLTVTSDGEFVAKGGRARLLVAQPKGRAFDSKAAHAFVSDFDAARARVAAKHPKVSMSLTGGQAMNVALQALFIRDLAVSGTLSTILVSLTFLLTFRRARALIAVFPPLVIGTVWTMGLAALAPNGLSAISVAFAAVVVGVGVDTGVHVYAALLEGRQNGLDPNAAALHARKRTARPTMLAAIAAGVTFGSLALSQLRALRELGILCGLGEVLTSIAILALTPEIGALLEQRSIGKAPEGRALVRTLVSATKTRARAWTILALAAVPLVLLGVLGWPTGGKAIVVLRPKHVEPLDTQRAIFESFGGKPGQWVVLSTDKDETKARNRSDRIAEALEPLRDNGTVEGFDALASFAPGPALAKKRLAARDALDLPALRPRLEQALDKAGFDTDACAPALDAFAHPNAAPPDDPLPWVRARHIAEDRGDWLSVVYVRPSGDPAKDARAVATIRAADPGAIVTGYARLEVGLKQTLAHDLPRIGLAALALVAIALGASLRRVTDVVLAGSTLAVAIAVVALFMRVFHVPWHAYDALVVPVLLGITMDEAMFLIYAAREGETPGGNDPAHEGESAIAHALREQGPLVIATALTTSAGFAALLACRFEGLFDVGAVGAVGSVAGVAAALLVVPAGLALAKPKRG